MHILKLVANFCVAMMCFASSAAGAADAIHFLPEANSVASAAGAAASDNKEQLSGTLPIYAANSWLHVKIENPDTAIIHVPSHSAYQYSVYSLQTADLLETFVSPFDPATHIDWNPKFTLSLDRSWGNEFLIQLNMITTSDMPYSLLSFEEFQDINSQQLINSGDFYGAIALMALFSFLLFMLNNNKDAGRLSISFTVWFFTMLSIWGYGSSAMPFGLSSILPALANQLNILGSITGALFTAYFLRSVILNSVIYKALWVLICLHILYFIVSFAIAPLWLITILVNIFSSLLCFGCCILAIMRGDAAAKYLAASSLLISSPFIFIFFSPFNQQTIIIVGIGALVLVMLALLQRMAEQAQSLSMKADLAFERERFLASMSHEIRTPLNGIIGFSELANQEKLEGKVKTYFQQIDRSSKVLLGIVNEVLDYAKLQVTEITPDFAALDIKQTIEDVITVNLTAATKNGVDLSYEIDEQLPQFVITDPQRCLQILINLCGNAVKFSKNGSVKIAVSQENTELVFKVIDNGIGISKEVLAGLFNPFKQADASTARQFGGTGLGLAISKQLSELLGGTLYAVSEYGKGSTFTLRLPYEKAQPPATQQSTDVNSLKGKRVLIAEDNPVNLMLATQILKNHGLKTDSAGDGKIAIAQASDNDYDLILMDMQMPELSGTQATIKIRELGIKTPVIAMTANTSDSDRQECLTAGMNDFIAKPIEQQLLLQKLVKWMATD